MSKIDVFREKVRKSPDNQLFRFSLGQALYESGAYHESIEHLQHCTDSRADWMLPRILLGKALMQEGHPEAARPILKEALKLAIAQSHEDPAAELRELLQD